MGTCCKLSLKMTATAPHGGFEFHQDDVLTAAKHLSAFQVEKFTMLFNTFFDIKKNGLIEHNDFDAFTEKLRAYTGWKKDSQQYLALIDVDETFYECLKDQVKAEWQAQSTTDEEAMISWEDAFVKYSDTKIAKSMNLKQWLNMWGRLCYGSAGISDFPIWVQILPDIFFKVIDRDEDGLLAYEEYLITGKLMRNSLSNTTRTTKNRNIYKLKPFFSDPQLEILKLAQRKTNYIFLSFIYLTKPSNNISSTNC